MSELQHNEIVYEEGWRENAPITQLEQTPVDEQEPSDPLKDDARSRPLLIILQLVLCLMAALVLFLLKAMDSGAYYDFMDAYRDELDRPIVSQGVFDALDPVRLFGDNSVTVEATPDEAQAR